uniref:Uncharacterized protein n=1 Tax=Lactuca sativa TaxID=4236 RepID=A0A9R1X3K6_LACSA|nr:hypothetical protein LSAT_V11C700349350 [Lactuca sativa]
MITMLFVPYMDVLIADSKVMCSMENKSSSPKPMNGEGLYNKLAKIKESDVEQISTGKGGKIKKRKIHQKSSVLKMLSKKKPHIGRNLIYGMNVLSIGCTI